MVDSQLIANGLEHVGTGLYPTQDVGYVMESHYLRDELRLKQMTLTLRSLVRVIS